MSIYDQRPWLGVYDQGTPAEIEIEHPSALAMFRAAARSAPDRPLLHYFDATRTVAEVDADSDALAAGLAQLGVAPGDRVAVFLQNVPQWMITMLAVWKAGGIVVPINPMLRERELQVILADSGATTLVALESLHPVATAVQPGTAVRTIITTSELDYLGEDVPKLLAGTARTKAADAVDLLELIEAHRGAAAPDVPEPGLDDVAFLTYTSGTTGPPKGAMNTHRNVVFNARTYRDWIHLGRDDVILGVAPLFHITGLIGHLAVATLIPAPLVLGFRFDAGTTLDLIERWRATFVVGAIPVFVAWMNHETAGQRDLSSLTKVYSGGAPVAPAIVEAFEKQFGPYIHNAYGLTETTSPSHVGPPAGRAPVDPNSGALSIGVPVFNTMVRIVGDDGEDLSAGEIGEIVTSGPQVVPGYWNNPEQTAHALPDGVLHTGDVGFMDPAGWFYIVDRKKDQINAGGYKIWPREVEDVLYEHDAVREAAVVGVPDSYRGETVKAFVSLKPGRTAEPADLIAHCKERMAAYKYPRQVEILDELPKTVSGKILRRELRGPASG
ncbi:class I adenylate-forming enzyme family protein [Pseudonocardia acidicola]|uniref:Long-chain fatty acid--CoA ligase n=1 Tax=Pseudonocardia acidicola TaxID=2724939 RepID=A0ABX1SNL1_9PSEU|nr:AMP-binding protein [Pseudonocardia acidicola]NMI02154.1 long-chain fatty acid--CoA ligase [Pseudonocardia acidicola]